MTAMLAVGVLAACGAGHADTLPCDATAAIVALQPTGPSPLAVTARPDQMVDFVNQTDASLTVTVADGQPAAVGPNDCIAFPGATADYSYTVSGYAAGDVVGSVHVAVPATVTIAPHASIFYGTHLTLTGTATGPAGSHLDVWARPLDSPQRHFVASLMPAADGTWQLPVAPSTGTEYTAVYAGASFQRIVNVQPLLHVRKRGRTITATIVPPSGRFTVQLFRYTPAQVMLWTTVRTTQADGGGVARFRRVPPGRYYVGVIGGSRYLDTASEPFNLTG